MSFELADEEGPEGCYLIFESISGGRLMLLYSRGEIPLGAIGFWCPGPGRSIQGFKFKQAGGRVELIKGIAGGDQNRRKYYSGWCQFLKLVSETSIQFNFVVFFLVSREDNGLLPLPFCGWGLSSCFW
jgi:hypothetical protein